MKVGDDVVGEEDGADVGAVEGNDEPSSVHDRSIAGHDFINIMPS